MITTKNIVSFSILYGNITTIMYSLLLTFDTFYEYVSG